MAKKTISREKLKKEMALDKQVFLLQPIAVSMMRYDYDVAQVRAVVNIIKEMQKAIEAVVYGQSTPEEQLSLWDSSDFVGEMGEGELGANEIALKIPLKNFACDVRKYDMLKNSLLQLASIPVEIPVKSLKNEDYDYVSNLCAAYIPKKAYNKFVYLKLNKSIALRLISKNGGTHKFLEAVMMKAKSKYTQRMYLFISAWRTQGATCERSVTWLRQWLRLENTYTRWNEFERFVLKRAETELKEMAERGESDLYFSTVKIYEPGRTRSGEPDRLKFNIIEIVPVKLSESDNKLSDAQKRVGEYCRKKYGIKGNDLKTILSLVTAENYQRVEEYLSELEKREIKALKAGKIENLSRHAYTCILNELENWKIEKELNQTLFLEENPSSGESTEGKEAVETMVPACNLSAEDVAKWDEFLNILRPVIPGKDFQNWFADGGMNLFSVEGNNLICSVPSSTFVEMIYHFLPEVLPNAFQKVWGEGVQVRFKVKA